MATLPQYADKTLIAHRGASAYAPENTLPAYRLALRHGADYVEQDLQISKDGVLVCLHDLTLERTTDVAKVFPERFRREPGGTRRWYVSDFTLEEIKRLDAGAWFGQQFTGTRIPTWQEAIEEIRGKAGLYPETKAPEVYGSRGFDVERLVVDQLRKNGLAEPGADPRTPVIIQSFSAASLRKMTDEPGCKLPKVLLMGVAPQELEEIRRFAVGIGLDRNVVRADPGLVKRAHAAGLSVTVYTVSSSDPGPFSDVREGMAYYLFTLGVDALFTDNPDQFPRAAR